MAMDFCIETGEYRETSRTSIRTYFYYVTPTGQELPVYKGPIQRVSSRENSTYSGTRSRKTFYFADSPVILKMFTSVSSFGKPLERKAILIEVSPDAEEITLKGYRNSGGFEGRGKLLTSLTQEELKTFSFKIVSPPKQNTRGVRKVIFQKEKRS